MTNNMPAIKACGYADIVPATSFNNVRRVPAAGKLFTVMLMLRGRYPNR